MFSFLRRRKLAPVVQPPAPALPTRISTGTPDSTALWDALRLHDEAKFSLVDVPPLPSAPVMQQSSVFEHIMPPNYIPRNIILVFVQSPQGASTLLTEQLKALFELHTLTFTGLSSQLCLLDGFNLERNVAQSRIKYELQCDPSLTFTIRERKDRIVGRILDDWITSQELPLQGNGLCLLAFEPTQEYDDVLDAWLITDILPGSTGACVSTRDLTKVQVSPPDYSIELHYQQIYRDKATLARARAVYARMCVAGINPQVLEERHVDPV